MSKIRLISRVVTNVISDWIPEEDIRLFQSIADLIRFLEEVPEMIDELFITSEIIEGQATKSFRQLCNGIKSGYIRANKIYLITENKKSKELEVLEYFREAENLNIIVLEGPLQQDFIASCVRGDTRDENQKFNRKTVIRMRASDYKGPVKLNIENIDEDTPIISEEEKLNKIPAQRLMETYTRDSDFITRLTQITGLHSSGKTTFMLLLAQYLSGYGKTIIIETDLKYFSISYNIEMGNLECTKIPLSSFYLEPLEFVEKIKNSSNNLICLTCTSKDKLNPPNIQHILDVIYNILNKEIRYILLEEALENITFNLYTIVLMQNNVISAIKTIDSLPNRIDNCLFAAVDTSIEDISIYDSKVLEKILSLQTSYNNKEIPIYSIKNLKLGKGDGIYDLRRYV